VTTFGYHASHEQFDPAELLAAVRAAERAGFAGASCSDHLHPWSEAQGQGGFVWSWLGAAMETTSRLTYGTVSAPGWRYHPVILAQAVATLGFMYPGRIWIALGSGEALNEGVTGLNWPPKPERNARLRECAEVMRALWAGETVTHRGRVTVEEARLYTRPARPPRVAGAAVTAETARWLGGWADALITVGSRPRDVLRGVIDAFREGGGGGKPVCVQAKIAWAPDEAAARAGAFDQWRTNVLEGDVLWELRTTRQFEQAASHVRPEDMDRALRISSDLDRHAAWLNEYAEMGVDEVYVHNVVRNQRAFVEAFGGRVLPQLGAAPGARGA
jgi:coenzyme F420-dependent glucose-6-phosphate dehydrogenase